jgi:two-component system LytT family response regulator
MLEAAIIDDEIKGRLYLRQLCEKFEPRVKIIGEAGNANEASLLLEMAKPRLIFLDIEMPGMSGVEWLKTLPNIDFEVVFVTAFNQYAVDAFRLGAVDYLLKPVSPDDLNRAIDRVERNLQVQPEVSPVQALARQYGEPFTKITIPSLQGFEFVDFHDIVFLESDSNYSVLHLTGKRKIVATRTLGDFEALLEPYRFFRVHKSYLINLAHIQKYTRGEGGTVLMEGGMEIDVSRRKKESFLASLKISG